MEKNKILSLKGVFIDVHRKTKRKDIPHEFYYVVFNSACGLYAVKLNKKETIDDIFNPIINPKGNSYFDFSKYGKEWEVNEILGDKNSFTKESVLEICDLI